MSRRKIISFNLAGLQIAVAFLTACTGNLIVAVAEPVDAQTQATRFSQKAFETVWQRTDQPVAAKRAERSWYWGPLPLTAGLYENYVESPYGQRLVQYFDKTRMEINNPAAGQVTNGLLVVELITGRVQQGDNTFDEQATAGAAVAVAGDPTNSTPTYRQLISVFNRAEPQGAWLVGFPVKRRWEGGQPAAEAFDYYRLDKKTEIAVLQNGFGVPQAFWEFMNRQGTVYTGGRYSNALISDWRFSVGLPLTEAYWARVAVGGVAKDVLFQAFERRVLTYTPDNPEAYQVEMGNVGQHYLQWRYEGKLPQPQTDNPLVGLLSGPLQPRWYQTSAVLNIRTAPTAEAGLAESSSTRPFVTQLQPGDRLKVLRTVRGQAVEPGHDRWFQIYEKPDLFVYSKYTEPLTIPAFPTPPRTYQGLWVAVSLGRQMMAVYNNQQLIFSTIIASGRPGFETVRGSFRVIGGWRPLSQTMEGGNRAAGDGYKLEEVRNVTYFYQDFAIHGSYWHAKFGIAPQSHGCVNATVYDAGLIHQLPVGSPVEVF